MQGQTIAVIGQSDIRSLRYRKFSGTLSSACECSSASSWFPALLDPGYVTGDEGESDLDLEYAGGIAYGRANSVRLFQERDYHPSLTPSIRIWRPSSATATPDASPICHSASAQSPAKHGAAGQRGRHHLAIASAGDSGAAMCDTSARHPWRSRQPDCGPSGSHRSGRHDVYREHQLLLELWKTTATIPPRCPIFRRRCGTSQPTPELSAGGGGYSIFYHRPEWQTGPGHSGRNGTRGTRCVSNGRASMMIPT